MSKVEGYTEENYRNIAKDILDCAKSKTTQFNPKPSKDGIWDLPKDDESMFEMYMIEEITHKLKMIEMSDSKACMQVYIGLDEQSASTPHVLLHFASVEDVYRFQGWYSAILGYYKESAKARITVR